MRKLCRVVITELLLVVFLTTICFSTGYAVAHHESIQPMYVLTGATRVTLTISESGEARCYVNMK